VKDMARQGDSGGFAVALSACDTGQDKMTSGGEMMGMTRAFMYAGASPVPASLWRVDDASTRQLMRLFYTNLKFMDNPKALQTAQVSMIRGVRYLHPYCWSGFLMIGGFR
jgi:CHAT domain-containing protein